MEFLTSETFVTAIQNCFTDSFSANSIDQLGIASEHLYDSITTTIDYSSWQFYLFLYIAFCIGSSITLSREDIKGAWSGLIILIILIFAINLISFWYITPNGKTYLFVSQALTVFYSVLLFSLILNLIASSILISITALKKLLFR